VTLGTRHGGASRVVPRFGEQRISKTSSYRERPALRPGVATVREIHKCSAARWPFMGKQWRTTHSGSKARTQARVQEMGTTQEKGEATVLTAGRRCRCRRLDGDGGAAWTFAVAPGSLLCIGLPASAWVSSSLVASSPAPLDHRRPPAAARRWRRGARLLLPRLHSYPASTLLFPRGGAHKERGKPQEGSSLREGLDPGLLAPGQSGAGARIGGPGSHWRIFPGR
jgi:hypothetical protein